MEHTTAACLGRLVYKQPILSVVLAATWGPRHLFLLHKTYVSQHDHHTAILSTVLQLGQPTPTASAVLTGAVVGTGTGTGTSTGGNLFSTLVGIVTHHSDSRRVEPRAFNIPLTGIVGCGVAALSFLGGFILMLGA